MRGRSAWSGSPFVEPGPWSGFVVAGLEGLNVGQVVACQVDIVPPILQFLHPDRVKLGRVGAIANADGLTAQVDADLLWRICQSAQQRVAVFGTDPKRSEAVVDAVRGEDVAEAGRDDGLDPEIDQRIGCRLALGRLG